MTGVETGKYPGLHFRGSAFDIRQQASDHGVRQPDFRTAEPAQLTTFSLPSHISELAANPGFLLVLSTASRGALRVEVAEEKVDARVTPGLLTLVPPGENQFFDFRGRTTNHALQIETSVFEETKSLDQALPNIGCLEPNLAFYNPRIQALVAQYVRICHSAALGWQAEKKALSMQVALELFRYFAHVRSNDRASHLEQSDIALLAEYVDKNLEEELDLALLANLVEREPFGFGRAFKAATGETPHQFIIHRRLDRVRSMLERSDEPLAEIALATGFSSQSHMTATFTRHVGMPPGRYRREVSK